MRVALREMLPARRRSETFEMIFGGQHTAFSITVSYYDEGPVGEVFIDGARFGSGMSDLAHDAAVLLSLALQYGVPLSAMQHAVSRDGNHQAATIIGAVIDRIIAHEEKT